MVKIYENYAVKIYEKGTYLIIKVKLYKNGTFLLPVVKFYKKPMPGANDNSNSSTTSTV